MSAVRLAGNAHGGPLPCAVCCVVITWILCLSGCARHFARISSARDAVPVQQLPAELLAPDRPGDIPIDFALLGQRAPATHVIDCGDLLGVYIQGVLPADEGVTPRVSTNNISGQSTYPATGQVHGPVIGVPCLVDSDGMLPLPLVGSLSVYGLTLTQAGELVRKAYVVDHRILQPGRDTIVVSLIKPRVHRILVIREDIATAEQPSFLSRGSVPYTRQPPSLIIDLPTRQNDVLHALIASGGMPGIDAHSEVWVTRRRREMTPLPPVDRQAPQETVQNAQEPRSFRVPLRLGAGEAFPCCERDMVLDDGDVLFVPARNCEVFYTGGLIAGGQFPLPRDRSLSLMEAMAMANGPVGGPAGIATNGANLNFVNGGLGGIVNPTQVIVVRKLPSGEQIKIAVNLNRAAKDEKEQLVIIPNDLILLEFTPKEYASNLLLSLVRPFIIISPIETTAINNAVVNNVAIPGGPAEPAAGGATAP